MSNHLFFQAPLLTLALLLSGASNAQTSSVPVDSITARTFIKFESSFFDFGTVAHGKSVVKVFQFANTGTDSLRISDVKVTCGCTIPVYPKEPIAPGATGTVQITFNTAGKSGRQLKVIRVVANTIPAETILQIAGEIKGKTRRHKT